MTKSKKILIVDDEDTLRQLVRAELESNGYSVEEAAGGEEALTYLAANEVDLVILDIKMPGLGGIDVLQRIREDDLARKVVMLTGVGELKIARECLELGAADFMSKPFEINNLLACINRVMME